MRLLDKVKITILLLGCLLATPNVIFGQTFKLVDLPEWVISVDLPTIENFHLQNHTSGVAYLLVDEQNKVDENQVVAFRHYAEKAITAPGVQGISQISISFDPTYQTVQLHSLSIHRNGDVVPRFDRSQINLIQREKELEYQVYDGSKTINIIIEDVREGDVVEYSYSIIGSNPIFAGHYSDYIQLGWSVPVGLTHYRILWSKDKKLFIKNYKTTTTPTTTNIDHHTEYVWKIKNPKEVTKDKNTPSWFSPYPIIYLSDYASWKDVVEWALPLYQESPVGPLLQTVIEQVIQSNLTKEKQILAALDFVQDEVRYLGIETGTRSHKPNMPEKVIKQRFGDCKDKSRLLVSLLRAIGVEAWPALVNTNSGILAKTELPTPYAFNHVIVLVNFNGKRYWLDPTRSQQNGNLQTIYKPDYEYALVISEDSSDFIKMSDDINVIHKKIVEEYFDISTSENIDAPYQIKTLHQNYYAESFNSNMDNTNQLELQNSYLNYMANYFSEIKIEEDTKVNIDENNNTVTTIENYSIPEIWKESEDKNYIAIDFEPFLIFEHISTVDGLIRSMPYEVTHPVQYNHVTRIKVPKYSKFENERTTINDSAFSYSQEISFSDDLLTIEYLYSSLKDHVDAKDIKQHSKNIEDLRNLSFYQVQKPNPAINIGEPSFSLDNVNWIFVTILGGSLLVLTPLIWRYIYLYNPAYTPPSLIDTSIKGLGGWLIIPAFGVLATPVRLLFEFWDTVYLFSAQQWAIVRDQFGTPMMIFISFEQFVSVFLFIMALFLIRMFFTKRNTFPKIYIGFMLFALLFTIFDLITINMAFSHIELDQNDTREVTRQIIFTGIWTFYFICSKRVKNTFTKQLKNSSSGSAGAS